MFSMGDPKFLQEECIIPSRYEGIVYVGTGSPKKKLQNKY